MCVPVEERVAVQSSMCVGVPRAHVTVSLWVHMGDCPGRVAKCECGASCDWLQGQLAEGLEISLGEELIIWMRLCPSEVPLPSLL